MSIEQSLSSWKMWVLTAVPTAVLTAGLTAGVNWMVNDRQIASQSLETLREERRVAYADYLATIQELGRVAPRFSAGAVQEETGEYAKYRERWRTAYTDSLEEAAVVYLLADPELYQVTYDLQQDLAEVANAEASKISIDEDLMVYGQAEDFLDEAQAEIRS